MELEVLPEDIEPTLTYQTIEMNALVRIAHARLSMLRRTHTINFAPLLECVDR